MKFYLYKLLEFIPLIFFAICLVIIGLLCFGINEPKTGEKVKIISKDDYEVKFLFKKDKCSIYRFVDNQRYHYFTDCAETLTTQFSSSGKTIISWDENIKGK